MTTNAPVAIVTGATGGMGREIVRDLAADHHVIAVGRNTERLAELAESTGADTWAADIAEPEALAERIAALDRVDVLAHVAAIAHPLAVAEATREEWDAHFAINVTAPALLTRAALPALRRSSGTVVFIGSGASTRPVPGSAVYAASKHALKGLADTLRIDEEPHRVRVATVSPGQTDTEMLRAMVPEASYTPDRYVRPDSVAAAVRFVIDAPADVHITDLPVRPRQEIARL
ncbi:SDR family oxidoreductase [Microbacterium halophytorum]|uniref:SDR family oxidoreductase n=1 Tax=Microbacterium halophytorum TaxID=2067568 RepID=UPI000CFC099A|nr:SDR family oxidoreductase [Microbacterium halophytorum]